MDRQTTGIVLETRADTIVVLTAEGIFTEIPVRQLDRSYAVGETVTVRLDDQWFVTPNGIEPGLMTDMPPSLPVLRRVLQSLRGRKARWSVAVAGVLLVLSIGLGTYRVLAAPAYEVAVDINPSLTLQVNNRHLVRQVVPNDPAAAAIVSAVDLRGMDVVSALQMLITTASELGYLTGDGSENPVGSQENYGRAVLVSILAGSKSRPPEAQTVAAALREVADRLNTSFVAGVQLITPEDSREAREHGLTAARWALATELRRQGISLSDEEIRSASIAELLRLASSAVDKGGGDNRTDIETTETDPADPFQGADTGNTEAATAATPQPVPAETKPAPAAPAPGQKASGETGEAAGTGRATQRQDKQATWDNDIQRDKDKNRKYRADNRKNRVEQAKTGDRRDNNRHSRVSKGQETKKSGLIINTRVGRGSDPQRSYQSGKSWKERSGKDKNEKMANNSRKASEPPGKGPGRSQRRDQSRRR